jgi:PAS domain-containing protein
VSTRISALQSLAVAQAELLVKRLEQQIVESLATTGDWHTMLFSSPRLLLQAVDAPGAALLHDDQLVTAGNVPSSEDIRRIVRWIATECPGQPLAATHALPRVAPEFAHLTTSGTGVLAIALAGRSMDYLLWFRPEQVQSVRWGGDPHKGMDASDPNFLSPRRSFAVWTEETRGTSRHWTEAELGIAARVRASLVDMVQQVRAVRVLIAQEQLQRVMRAVQLAPEPTLIMGNVGQLIVVNRAFRELLGQTVDLSSAEDLQHLFTSEADVLDMLTALRVDRRLWIGELTLRAGGDLRIPLAVRAEPVPGEDGNDLGYVLFATDLRARHDSEAARQRLQDVIVEARQRSRPEMIDAETTRSFSNMLEAILASARRSVTDVSTSGNATPVPSAMASIESLTRRAAELALQLEGYAASRRRQ